MHEASKRLLKTIKVSTSPYHTVKEAKRQLKEEEFTSLDWHEDWKLKRGKAYYVSPFGNTLIAFRINPGFTLADQIRIATAHVDTPGLRIKSGAEYTYKNYKRLNVEVYGGVIYHTWLDRPLSMAGTVCLKGKDAMHPKLRHFDCGRPLFVIPGLSIHMNREVNKGVELNPQIDLLPVAGTGEVITAGYFMDFLAKEIGVAATEILSFDICLYVAQDGCICGFEQDMFCAPRIDNVSSVQACLTAMTRSSRNAGIDAAVLFDHEEVGSRSKNGAAGNLLPLVIERIYENMDVERKDYIKHILNGFMISADSAHGLNPNHPEKYDPTTAVQLNEGICIKCASKQSYSGDCKSWASLKALGQENQIPCKYIYNRSDIQGGSTLGAALSAVMPMQSADIGTPVLAMHSAMETAGVKDQYYLEQFLIHFFNHE